jgi:hypothetical protein
MKNWTPINAVMYKSEQIAIEALNPDALKPTETEGEGKSPSL